MGDKQGWSQEIIDDWLLRKSAKIPDSYPYTVTLGEVIDIPMISFPPVLEDASLRARFPRNSSHIAVPPPPPPNMKSAKCSLKVGGIETELLGHATVELIKEETMKIVPQEWINHLLLFRNKSGIFCVHYAHGQSKVYVSTMLGEETEDLPADVLLTELLSFTVRHPPTALYYNENKDAIVVVEDYSFRVVNLADENHRSLPSPVVLQRDIVFSCVAPCCDKIHILTSGGWLNIFGHEGTLCKAIQVGQTANRIIMTRRPGLIIVTCGDGSLKFVESRSIPSSLKIGFPILAEYHLDRGIICSSEYIDGRIWVGTEEYLALFDFNFITRPVLKFRLSLLGIDYPQHISWVQPKIFAVLHSDSTLLTIVADFNGGFPIKHSVIFDSQVLGMSNDPSAADEAFYFLFKEGKVLKINLDCILSSERVTTGLSDNRCEAISPVVLTSFDESIASIYTFEMPPLEIAARGDVIVTKTTPSRKLPVLSKAAMALGKYW